ncbi:MAG: hypothetical protein V4553_03950 [Bacteroidota bacterium]
MPNQSLINIIKETLLSYPYISIEQSKENELVIDTNSKNGFLIALVSIPDEYRLYFNDYAKHYDDTEEDRENIIDLIIAAICGTARIKEFSKGNRPYKWQLEIKNANQDWEHIGTTAYLMPNFWTKPSINYLQNDRD